MGSRDYLLSILLGGVYVFLLGALSGFVVLLVTALLRWMTRFAEAGLESNRRF